MFFILLMVSSSACATWYEGQAADTLSGQEYSQVRSRLVDVAIKNAAMQAGVYIHVENSVSKGLLTASRSVLESKHTIRQVILLDEILNGDRLTIRLKVDIEDRIDCELSRHDKSITLAQFPFADVSQASNGSIFPLPIHIAARLKNLINAADGIVVERIYSKAIFNPKGQLSQTHPDILQRVSNDIYGESQTQYLLFGYIRDVSLFSLLRDNGEQRQRNFTLSVFLYDRTSNRMVLEKEFHGEANWLFDEFGQVDLSSSLFWRSDFGKMVVNRMADIAADIASAVRCEPLKSRVLSKTTSHIDIDVGRLNDVRVGDRFVVPSRGTVGREAQPAEFLSEKLSADFEVISVERNSSRLVPRFEADVPDAHYYSVGVGDVVLSAN